MRKALLFILLPALCMFLVGSVAHVYAQRFDYRGNSYFEENRDLSSIVQSYPEGALDKIKEACGIDQSLGCSVSGSILTTRIQLSPDSGYYTYAADYGFPFTTTSVTVNKIPSDLFAARLNNILASANLASESAKTNPIDLSDKAKGAQLAAAWQQIGLDVTYNLVMPNGQAQKINLASVLADSRPISAAIQEPNYGLLALSAGMLVLAAFAASFFGNKGRK